MRPERKKKMFVLLSSTDTRPQSVNSDRSRIRFGHDDTDECVYKRGHAVSFARHNKGTELSALVRTRTWCVFLNARRVYNFWSI